MAFEIVRIGRDNDSVRSYVEEYKAFRLYALKNEPEAFGSTYEREVKFTDEEWYSRLANPEAVTFFALHEKRIVSTLTALGHLMYGPEELSASSSPWQAAIETSGESAPLHYRIFGMYTLPKCRGQGLAKALMDAAIKYGKEDAAALGRPFVGSIVTDETNLAAIKLYQKVHFVPVNKLSFGDTGRTIVLFKYLPSLASAIP